MTRKPWTALATAGLSFALAFVASGGLRDRSAVVRSATFPNDDKTILHVLNRITFGLRPGDVENIRDVGLQRYIEEQLHPDRVQDSWMNKHLAGLTTIEMSSREIAEKIELPQLEARRE